MLDILNTVFPFVLCIICCAVLCLLLGLVLHASGYFIVGHTLVAMSGFCGKWVVRNCPYEIGDKCPCWNCPKVSDKKHPCLVFQAYAAANRMKRAERKTGRMARKRPQEQR